MEKLQEQFTQQINDVVQNTSHTSKDNPLCILKITKNDSIKRKVTSILKQLEENKPILIASLSNSIPKSISIIEIVKLTLKEKNKTVRQYNKLTHIESTQNPNHKPKNEEVDNKIDKSSQQIEQEILQSINGPKVFQLPVMYVILSIEELTFDLSNWTSQ